MDLRRRTMQTLAAAGAFLVVAGLSLSGGVATAAAEPTFQPPADAAKATSTSSDGKSNDESERSSKRRKKDSNRATTDSDSDRSTGTTATTAATATTSTAPPRTTATTRPPPTATSGPAPTTTTAPATTRPPTAGSSDGDSEVTPQQTEAPDDPATADPATTGTTTASRRHEGSGGDGPGSRPGSGLPPGIYPVDPDSGDAGSGSSPRPRSASAPAPAPVATVPGGPGSPVAPAVTQPGQDTAGATANSGVAADPATAPAPATEVSGAGQERQSPAATTRQAQELVVTGDATRRLILFGGVAMLVGAVVIAFTGRERPRLTAAGAAAGPVAARRRPRPRRELDGWEDGVPLAPAKRELARHRLGISAEMPDDEPGA